MAAKSFVTTELPLDLPILPEGWDYVPLSKLVDEHRGISYGIVQPGSPVSTGTPIIRVNDIRDGRINDSDTMRISPEIESKYNRTRLHGGELLLTLVGTVGESAIVPKQLTGWNVARAVAVLPCNGDVSAPWVHLCLRSATLKHFMRIWCTTTVQATLNLRDVARLPIPVPPKRERQRITEILGSLDDKIELNRRMNETLEAMARRLFKSWFIDFDPVHAKAALRREHPKLSNTDLSRRALPNMAHEIAELFPDSFENSTLGPIPKGWSARPLYSIANFVNGAAFKNSDFCDPSIGKPVIKIAELKSGIDSQTKFSQKDVGPDREIHRGDTLYSWSGSPDTSLATFRWTGRDGLLNQHIFKVITKNRPDAIFAYYQLNDLRDTLVEIARNKQTTGLGHVTVEDMKRLHVIHPAPEALKAFACNADPIYDQSFTLSADSLTLELTRDKLLPRLLSGDLQLHD
jgi:type I restriction enzyme S subunit